MTQPSIVAFSAGRSGEWRIERVSPVVGESLAGAEALAVREAPAGQQLAEPAATWTLRGVVSNVRYAAVSEVAALRARQQGLGRPAATCAALIPIRKSERWWALAQDERRSIMEERSRHIAIGLEYLPGVARRLHHGRDIGEPFDFLTWFEYPPEHADAFEELVKRLRDAEEWTYVDREVDLRLRRA